MQDGAGHDGQADDHDGGHQVAQRGVVQERAVDDVGERDGLHDDEGGARRAPTASAMPATRRRPGTRAASSGSTSRGRPGRGGGALTG